jgi:DNA-binding NarL/FixJ family response regulator
MLHADEDDRMLTQSILDEMQHAAPIIYFDHFDELKQYCKENDLPVVILVNNCSRLHNAIATVRQLKAESSLSHIPVVVLGEKTTPDYIFQYYRAGVNTYITKPSTLAATEKKIRLFFEYWLDVAEV